MNDADRTGPTRARRRRCTVTQLVGPVPSCPRWVIGWPAAAGRGRSARRRVPDRRQPLRRACWSRPPTAGVVRVAFAVEDHDRVLARARGGRSVRGSCASPRADRAGGTCSSTSTSRGVAGLRRRARPAARATGSDDQVVAQLAGDPLRHDAELRSRWRDARAIPRRCVRWAAPAPTTRVPAGAAVSPGRAQRRHRRSVPRWRRGQACAAGDGVRRSVMTRRGRTAAEQRSCRRRAGTARPRAAWPRLVRVEQVGGEQLAARVPEVGSDSLATGTRATPSRSAATSLWARSMTALRRATHGPEGAWQPWDHREVADAERHHGGDVQPSCVEDWSRWRAKDRVGVAWIASFAPIDDDEQVRRVVERCGELVAPARRGPVNHPWRGSHQLHVPRAGARASWAIQICSPRSSPGPVMELSPSTATRTGGAGGAGRTCPLGSRSSKWGSGALATCLTCAQRPPAVASATPGTPRAMPRLHGHRR